MPQQQTTFRSWPLWRRTRDKGMAAQHWAGHLMIHERRRRRQMLNIFSIRLVKCDNVPESNKSSFVWFVRLIRKKWWSHHLWEVLLLSNTTQQLLSTGWGNACCTHYHSVICWLVCRLFLWISHNNNTQQWCFCNTTACWVEFEIFMQLAVN